MECVQACGMTGPCRRVKRRENGTEREKLWGMNTSSLQGRRSGQQMKS